MIQVLFSEQIKANSTDCNFQHQTRNLLLIDLFSNRNLPGSQYLIDNLQVDEKMRRI